MIYVVQYEQKNINVFSDLSFDKDVEVYSYAEIFSCHWLNVKGDNNEGNKTKIIDKIAKTLNLINNIDGRNKKTATELRF